MSSSLRGVDGAEHGQQGVVTVEAESALQPPAALPHRLRLHRHDPRDLRCVEVHLHVAAKLHLLLRELRIIRGEALHEIGMYSRENLQKAVPVGGVGDIHLQRRDDLAGMPLRDFALILLAPYDLRHLAQTALLFRGLDHRQRRLAVAAVALALGLEHTPREAPAPEQQQDNHSARRQSKRQDADHSVQKRHAPVVRLGLTFVLGQKLILTLSIDDFNIYQSMDDEEIIQKFGGPTSDIKIYANDKLICSSRSDLPWGVDWIDGADNRAEITMKNVLIDGEIPGCNTAVIKWNANKGNGFAPTFTSLQFRDTDDKVADRFQKSADGVIEFTVTDFSVEYNDVAQIVHFPIHEVESVKAEYAPHNSNDFLPLDIAEVPELFYSPGYGYFFRGSLASVDRPSIDGWFDLRLTATNAVGASIQQVISPAFHIEERTGVSSINADSDLFYTIDGRNITLGKNARIYNMDGRLCSPAGLAPGLYIISNGTASEKVVIK